MTERAPGLDVGVDVKQTDEGVPEVVLADARRIREKSGGYSLALPPEQQAIGDYLPPNDGV